MSLPFYDFLYLLDAPQFISTPHCLVRSYQTCWKSALNRPSEGHQLDFGRDLEKSMVEEDGLVDISTQALDTDLRAGPRPLWRHWLDTILSGPFQTQKNVNALILLIVFQLLVNYGTYG